MKICVKRWLGGVVLTTCLLVGSPLAYQRLSLPTGMFVDSRKFIAGFGSENVICNTGSNSGKFAFDWESAGLKGANFAMGPQSALYDFKILKSCQSCLVSNAVVVISLCPFTSIVGNHENKRTSPRYYPVLCRDEIVGYSFLTEFRVWLTTIGMGMRILTDVRLGSDQPASDEELESFTQGLFSGWRKEFSIKSFQDDLTDDNRASFAYEITLFRQMIDWCCLQGYKPVLVVPPVMPNYDQEFTAHFCKTYIYDFVEQLNRPNIPFLNYLKDERFRKPEYFVNSLMLNKTGRRLFTREIVNELRMRGVLRSK